MTIVKDDIIRVAARFKDEVAGDIVHVWHFQANGVSFSEEDDDVLDVIEAEMDGWYSGLTSFYPDTMTPYDLSFSTVAWVGGKEVTVRSIGVRAWTLTSGPASTQEPMPGMDAAIVNFRTLRPRSFGRKYMGPTQESRQESGILSNTGLTEMTDFITAVLTGIAMTSGGLVTGIISQYTDEFGAHFFHFIEGIANSILGTQRRRRPKRGS